MSLPATKILVVEDEDAMREVLRLRLAAWGYEVRGAGDARQAQELVESFAPDVVISDVVLPGLSGLELLKVLKERDPDRPVLLVTSHGTVDLAVEAMKGGARDFLTKPLDYQQLRATLAAVEEDLRARAASHQLSSELAQERGRFGELVGDSPQMRELYDLIREVASTDAAAMITGESGTGKELTARMIHQLSARGEQELVAVNTAAIPEELMESEIFGHEKGAFTGATGVRQGCFELAHRGTLFLDEIAEMPMALQPKLLRVLEDGRVRRLGGTREYQFDVRLVAATNQEPLNAVKEGRLRQDLLYRLNVFTIQLPALRERPADLPLLTRHFIDGFNRKHKTRVEGLREEALELLGGYSWPGNVRELRNVMERSVVVAKEGWIEPSHLPPYVRKPSPETAAPELSLPTGVTIAEAEKALILQTLEETGNNKLEAARRLGIATKTIYNKLKAYGIG